MEHIAIELHFDKNHVSVKKVFLVIWYFHFLNIEHYLLNIIAMVFFHQHVRFTSIIQCEKYNLYEFQLYIQRCQHWKTNIYTIINDELDKFIIYRDLFK